jgi:hypothetical protein
MAKTSRADGVDEVMTFGQPRIDNPTFSIPPRFGIDWDVSGV